MASIVMRLCNMGGDQDGVQEVEKHIHDILVKHRLPATCQVIGYLAVSMVEWQAAAKEVSNDKDRQNVAKMVLKSLTNTKS